MSIIPVGESIFITSNRDEKTWRSAAMPPACYNMKTGMVCYPKDGDAGGTWFAVHENGNVLVFLNGAFQKHIPRPAYRKSRGLILLDLIDQDIPHGHFSRIDLSGIEPFTAVLWQCGNLFVLRWDGARKYEEKLDHRIPQIWSSVTLYDETVIHKRRKWFTDWLQRNPAPGQEDIMHFHRFTGDGDRNNDLFMNREGIVSTVSITSLQWTNAFARLQYLDCRTGRLEHQPLLFIKSEPVK